jgi:4-amino-4-deoxy-L-arabinose transferase-like glycosyltransferase
VPPFDRRAGRELALLLACVLGVLALFLGKAYTIDDPLFLWLARQIQLNPLDFFGFEVNWYGTSMPMVEVTKNSPLGGYYIAGAAALVGFGERALHAAFLLPAAAAAVATYALARRLCGRPLEASLIGLFTPVFLVSSTNVMCDTLMLAFWCGAVACWIAGFDRRRSSFHAAAAALAALAVLTKYFGAALVPLLLAYGAIRERRLGAWTAWLLVPLAAMGAFEMATRSLYGVGLLSDAALYATSFEEVAPQGYSAQLLEGLAFAGGCLLPALFFAPLLWPRRVAAGGAFAIAAAVVLTNGHARPLVGETFAHYQWPEWALVAQIAALSVGGVSVLALAVADVWRRRDPESWLVALWVVGTLGFAVALNWVNNGRSNLPVAPILGIAIARRLELRASAGQRASPPLRWLAAVPAFALALAVTWADFRWSNDVRETAVAIFDRYGRGDDRVYFYGHWGFQWYMQELGATPVDTRGATASAGDYVVRPDDNVFVGRPDPATAKRVQVIARPSPRFLRTVGRLTGAGFYASNMGSLPFVFGRVLPDHYEVWRILPDSGSDR